jgi:hypothetical protein
MMDFRPKSIDCFVLFEATFFKSVSQENSLIIPCGSLANKNIKVNSKKKSKSTTDVCRHF